MTEKELKEAIFTTNFKIKYTQNILKKATELKDLYITPFDCDLAEYGLNITTIKENKVHIITYNNGSEDNPYPIIAKIYSNDGDYKICWYTKKGKLLIGADSEEDLIMKTITDNTLNSIVVDLNTLRNKLSQYESSIVS